MFTLQLLWLHPMSLCFQANRSRYIKALPCLVTTRDVLRTTSVYFCILLSSQTNLKLQETEVDPQRLAEVLMAADAVQELRQQCLKRGAAGIKGLGRQETYPSIKNIYSSLSVNIWICASIERLRWCLCCSDSCLKLMINYPHWAG